MRRKIDDSVIKELEGAYLGVMLALAIVSFLIATQLPIILSDKNLNEPFLIKYGPHIWVWAIKIFLILVICLAVNHWKRPFDLLRKRNDKIDEEEKVKLKAEADKEKVKSQIWVNE